ncbi:MAG: spermidine synthase [Candidatus Azotimanducaceae bacterium]
MLVKLIITALLLLILPSSLCLAKDIHQEKSLYRNIVVRETGQRRCLLFTVKRGDRNQTCIDIKNPKKLVFPYVRMTLGGLLLNHSPKDVLVIGLGGGSIPNTLSELYPEAIIDVVEIDEAVFRVAKQYFDFTETEKIKVHISDARVFIKRAGIRKQKYDLIILDAFTGDYIPEHLMTVEFLKETKALLKADGTLVANTFSTSKLYDHESASYQLVFGDFLNFKMPNTGNRVVLAKNDGLPDVNYMKNAAKKLSARLFNYGVDIDRYPAYMSRHKDWNENTRPLTDQYNPANLLQGDSR